MNSFDTILQEIKDEKDRQVLQELATRNPAIKEYGMRQDEFNSKLDQHRTEVLKKDTDIKAWSGWYGGLFHHPDGTPMSFEESQQFVKTSREAQGKLQEANKLKADLEAQLAAAQAGGEVGTLDLDKLATATAARLQGGGFVTAEQAKKTAEELVARAVTELRAHVDYAGPILLDVNDAMRQYERDHGKQLDRQKLLEFCAQNKLDIKTGYERFTAADYKAKAESETTAKIEAARKEGHDAGKLEAQTALANPESVGLAAVPGLTGLRGKLAEHISVEKIPEGQTLMDVAEDFGASVGAQMGRDMAAGKSATE